MIKVKLQVYALGGLGENGKNLYVIDVEKELFVLDAGIKYPTRELYGIDEIIPDFKVLLSRKEQIRGFFLSHAHEDHIGALPHILQEIKAPVYATDFTMELIKDQLKEKDVPLEDLKLITVDQNSTIKFGNVKVTFFKTTHSIPESIGIAVQTFDGTIVYTSNYTFNQTGDQRYQTDFQKINEIAEKEVLLLMNESLGSNKVLNGNKNQMLEIELNKAISSATERIIVSLFSSDLQKIQKVIDIALSYEKRIAIIGRRAQRIVDIALKMNYLSIPPDRLTNLRFIDEKNKNDDPDLVCLVTGERHEPFYMLQRMVKKIDRLIHVNEYDTIIIATAPIPGTEKMAARTFDLLYRSEANIVMIDQEYLTANHATSEEIKMMISMLKPKYIMPVIGEYRMQYQVLNIAKQMGYTDQEVFLLNNGDALRLDDQKPLIQKGRYRTGDIMIDGISLGDINEIVIHDRELLSEDGVLICIAHLNPVTKEIKGEIKIITKGFITEEDKESIKVELKKICREQINLHFGNKYVNWNELKNTIRDEFNKYLYKELRRRPVTIPVLIAVDNDEKN